MNIVGEWSGRYHLNWRKLCLTSSASLTNLSWNLRLSSNMLLTKFKRDWILQRLLAGFDFGGCCVAKIRSTFFRSIFRGWRSALLDSYLWTTSLALFVLNVLLRVDYILLDVRLEDAAFLEGRWLAGKDVRWEGDGWRWGNNLRAWDWGLWADA